MNNSRTNKTIIIAITLLMPAGLLLLSSCSRQKETHTKESAAWSSLVSPDSDLILIADIDALRKSAWYQTSRMSQPQQQEALIRKAGFSQDNVTMLLISSDLDALPQLSSLQAMAAPDTSTASGITSLQSNLLAKLNTSMFLMLDKEISWHQAREAVQYIFSSSTGTVITENPEKTQLTIRQDTSPVPLFVNLSSDKRILELRTAEQKTPSGSLHPAIDSFIREDSRLQTNGPVRAVFLISTDMQRKIKEGINGSSAGTTADPSSSMMSGLLKPFAELKSISLALNPQTNLTTVFCSMDVGTSDNASGAEAMMQSVLLPLITLALAQQAPDLPQNLIRETKTSTAGSRVVLEASLITKTTAELSLQSP